MAKNTIALTLKEPAETVIERTRDYAQQSGHLFEGDSTSGRFAGRSILGKIKGEYQIKEQTLEITLKEKPPLVPMKKVQKALEDYFNH